MINRLLQWGTYAHRVSLVALMAGVQLLATGCERVVGIEVDTGPERLVVEARLEAVNGAPSGRQSIRLTTTAPYFSNAPAPGARGAVVQVRDDQGRAVRFAESSTPGTYVTDSLVAAVGRTYTLRIEWRGDVYESTDRLDAVANIDSLYFIARPRRDAAKEGVRATIDLRDPPVVANYYLWDQFVDGVRQIAPDSLFRARIAASDEFFQGRRLRQFQPFDGVRVRSGQEVLIRQYSISETVWRYYDALNQQTNGDGSPFSTPPSSVRGNVANVTRPDVRALGYFSASAIAERRARVP